VNSSPQAGKSPYKDSGLRVKEATFGIQVLAALRVSKTAQSTRIGD
jgi:hypothetical protein